MKHTRLPRRAAGDDAVAWIEYCGNPKCANRVGTAKRIGTPKPGMKGYDSKGRIDHEQIDWQQTPEPTEPRFCLVHQPCGQPIDGGFCGLQFGHK